jgi:putative ABC transport system ATP-binding protein
MTSGDKMLEVRGVTKVYGKKESRFKALDHVTFSVPEGSVIAIIGKSGSGKSTLMHAMSGLDSVDEGKILLHGKDIQGLSRKAAEKFRAKEMGFIFQSFFIEPNQSVFQNVMLPLEIGRVRSRKRKELVLEALKSVELLDKQKSRARDLSGGQKQRLAIARAIVHKPKLIFADEPTGNLDSQTGEKVIQLLFELNKSLGCTLVIVTHDHELANRCQIKIELTDGKLKSMTKAQSTTASNTPRALKQANSRRVM